MKTTCSGQERIAQLEAEEARLKSHLDTAVEMRDAIAKELQKDRENLRDFRAIIKELTSRYEAEILRQKERIDALERANKYLDACWSASARAEIKNGKRFEAMIEKEHRKNYELSQIASGLLDKLKKNSEQIEWWPPPAVTKV